jgi:oxygen-dependent protoporphyrinogen oxidase
MDVSVYGATGGFGTLAGALLGAAESAGAVYAPATEVTRVDATSAGVVLQTSSGEARHDAVVVAVPAPAAARLLSGAELGVWLSRVKVEPTMTIAYRMDRPFPGDYFGLSFPRGDAIGDRVVALCVQSRKLAGLVPAGGDALVALPAPAATASLLAIDDAAAADSTIGTLEKAIPRISKRVTTTHVSRFEHGYTIFAPGYLTHLARFDNAWLPPRVAIAGDYTLAPSVEGAVRSGQRAARRILSSA